MCTSYKTRCVWGGGGVVEEVISLYTGYCLRDMKVKVDKSNSFSSKLDPKQSSVYVTCCRECWWCIPWSCILSTDAARDIQMRHVVIHQ